MYSMACRSSRTYYPASSKSALVTISVMRMGHIKVRPCPGVRWAGGCTVFCFISNYPNLPMTWSIPKKYQIYSPTLEMDVEVEHTVEWCTTEYCLRKGEGYGRVDVQCVLRSVQAKELDIEPFVDCKGNFWRSTQSWRLVFECRWQERGAWGTVSTDRSYVNSAHRGQGELDLRVVHENIHPW